MVDEWPVVKTMFKEEIFPNGWISMTATINISPREYYMLSLEVLVSGKTVLPNIKIDQQKVGNCQPKGISATKCSFFSCAGTLNKRFVSSDTGSIFLSLQYKQVDHQCDCTNKENCGQDEEISYLRHVAAAARISLTPIGKTEVETRNRSHFSYFLYNLKAL